MRISINKISNDSFVIPNDSAVKSRSTLKTHTERVRERERGGGWEVREREKERERV